MSKVRLYSRQIPFDADEVELLPTGWLRAVGSWPRWTDDDNGEIVIKHGPTREYTWPPHRIKEVSDD
jgi:hypothetical protein